MVTLETIMHELKERGLSFDEALQELADMGITGSEAHEGLVLVYNPGFSDVITTDAKGNERPYRQPPISSFLR